MKLTQLRKNGEPKIITYMRWGTILVVGLTTIGAFVGFVGSLALKWVAVPIVQDESRARAVGDSIIISEVRGLKVTVDVMAEAMKLTENNPRRRRVLNAAQNVRPQPVKLPADAVGGSQTQKKENGL